MATLGDSRWQLTRLRRLGGACTWVGLGIFAYNLQRMTVIAG